MPRPISRDARSRVRAHAPHPPPARKGVSLDAVRHTVVTARDVGVQTLLFLMLGAPDETRQEMLRTIEVATSLPASEASFSLFVPIPGTTLYSQMVQAGIEMSEDYTDYDYYARQPFTGPISRRELRLIQRLAYFRFYSHPHRWRSVARNASTLNGLRSMGRKLMRIVPHGAAPVDARSEEAARVVRGRAAK